MGFFSACQVCPPPQFKWCNLREMRAFLLIFPKFLVDIVDIKSFINPFLFGISWLLRKANLQTFIFIYQINSHFEQTRWKYLLLWIIKFGILWQKEMGHVALMSNLNIHWSKKLISFASIKLSQIICLILFLGLFLNIHPVGNWKYIVFNLIVINKIMFLRNIGHQIHFQLACSIYTIL